ncbi:hypothetical protein A0J61_07682 [Choanephora cucurbitarum]|uniref:Uncharacterized protein n=1 Tax=Choanephora cucurbitarum TaxID=101091 RepID=A0A1C7N591_9FUNG|nr:hypothetical protein A0J61_07682 [Choanephora cucurbitarum]
MTLGPQIFEQPETYTNCSRSRKISANIKTRLEQLNVKSNICFIVMSCCSLKAIIAYFVILKRLTMLYVLSYHPMITRLSAWSLALQSATVVIPNIYSLYCKAQGVDMLNRVNIESYGSADPTTYMQAMTAPTYT